MKHLEPDETWALFGIESQNHFIEKFVIEGKFHRNVPEVIRKEYEIVESLLFYSYYKYPLIDDAFARATKIFEAGVALRMRSLQLDNDDHIESLNLKLKKLEKYTSVELFKQWNYVRKLRNILAHHEAGRLFGTILFGSFTYIINVINSLFLDKAEILEHEKMTTELQGKALSFKKGLFIMKLNDLYILVESCTPHVTRNIKNKKRSLWCFNYINHKKEIQVLDDFAHPVMFVLENIEFENELLRATIVESGEKIEITSTNILELENQFKNYKNAVASAPTTLTHHYENFTNNRINGMISDFIYKSW